MKDTLTVSLARALAAMQSASTAVTVELGVQREVVERLREELKADQRSGFADRLVVALQRATARIAELEGFGGNGNPDPPLPPPVVVRPPVVGDGSKLIDARMLARVAKSSAPNLSIPRFDWLKANRALRTKKVGTFIYKANEVSLLENLDVRGMWASCLGFTSDFPEHRQGPLEMRNVGHSNEPGSQQHTKWGNRFWSMSDITRIGCDFEGMEEHGYYDNLSGSSMNEGHTFENLGGHSAYVCLRNNPTVRSDGSWQYPPNNAVPTEPTTHIISDCHSRNVCNTAAKGSDTVTFFNAGTVDNQASIYMRDCSDVQAFPHQMHTGTGEKIPLDVEGSPSFVRSYSAVTVKSYLDQRPLDTVGQHAHPNALFSAKNCFWDFTQSNKEFMNLNDIERIAFDQCGFIGRELRQPYLDIDKQALSEGQAFCDVVTIGDCVADGVSLRWHMPDGSVFVYKLDTPGMFVRITRSGSKVTVEVERYQSDHHSQKLETSA